MTKLALYNNLIIMHQAVVTFFPLMCLKCKNYFCVLIRIVENKVHHNVSSCAFLEVFISKLNQRQSAALKRPLQWTNLRGGGLGEGIKVKLLFLKWCFFKIVSFLNLMYFRPCSTPSHWFLKNQPHEFQFYLNWLKHFLF